MEEEEMIVKHLLTRVQTDLYQQSTSIHPFDDHHQQQHVVVVVGVNEHGTVKCVVQT
jgi:signal recognition particle GTPase